MTGPNTGLLEKVFDLFKQYGPMTRAEVEKIVGVHKHNVSAAVSRLHKRCNRAGKRIYVVGYVYDGEGSRRYPRAQYDVGDKPDAPKPKPDKKAIGRRYEQSRLTKFRNNSVFHLGKSRDKIREELRAT